MRSVSRERGLSAITWLIVIAVVGTGVVIGLRLVPVYLQYFTLVSIMEDVAQEAHIGDHSRRELWSMINKRMNINGIEGVGHDEIGIDREGDAIKITADYEVRRPLLGNLDAVAHFKKTVRSR